MRREAILLLSLLLVPVAAWSESESEQAVPAEPEVLSCGDSAGEGEFAPVKPRPLTGAERRDLERLFDQLDGKWIGSKSEIVCMLSGSVKQHGFRSTLRAHETGNGLELSGEDVRLDGEAKQRHKRRFFITPDGLRVDNSSSLGDVEPLLISDSAVSFVRRYRTVRRQESAGSGGGLVIQRQLADGSRRSLVVQSSAQAGADDDKRFSRTHEERYYLQLSGDRGLTITQQFFVQGAYTGSMVWQLRR
jgi:hypothetical protein